MDEKKENKQKIRLCWFSSRLYDDEGNEIISETKIDETINKYKSIKRASTCIHDMDKVSQFDLEKDEEGNLEEYWGKIGENKKIHIHGVIEFNDKIEVCKIAKWFGIPEHMICYQTSNKGEYNKNPFFHKTAYLTHEFEPEYKEKNIYSRNKVKIFGENPEEVWNKIDALNSKSVIQSKKTKKDDIDFYICEVACHGKTLKEVKEDIGLASFIRNEKLFIKARKEYIYNNVDMPAIRTIFYVEAVSHNTDPSKGGRGKTVCTHALAKQLAKEFGADINKSYEQLQAEGYIFELGGEGVALQSYDAQPVLVLNEMDAYSMYKAFGRRGTKELLDNFPTKQEINIKYSSVVVTAKYVIINGIQSYDDFIKGLAGCYGEHSEEDADLSQYYRRFFGRIIIVDGIYMDLLFNKGKFNDTKEYKEFYAIKNIYVEWRKVIEKFSGQAQSQIESKVLKPVLDQTKEREMFLNEKISNAEDIPEEFRKYGEVIEIDESPKEIEITKIDKDVEIMRLKLENEKLKKEIKAFENSEEINRNKIDEINWEHIK